MQRDGADQLSHTTNFVINNLRYFAFKKNVHWQNECFVKLSFDKRYTEGG